MINNKKNSVIKVPNQNNHIKFSMILLFACICFMSTPYLLRNMPRSIQIILVTICMTTCIFSIFKKKNYKKNISLIFIIGYWQMWEIGYRVLGISSAKLGNYLMSLLSYGTIIMMLYILSSYSKREKKFIGWFTFVILLFNIIDNIVLAIKYPGAQEDVNYPWGAVYLNMNVAQTSFYAVTMIFVGCATILALNTNSSKKRLIGSISALVGLYFLFTISPRATTCLIESLMLFLIFISHINKNKKLPTFATIMFMIVFLFISLKQMLTLAINMIGSQRLVERLVALRDILGNSSVVSSNTGSLGERLFYIKLSIDTFTSNIGTFIFGIGNHKDLNSIAIGIGQHSGIIDTTAKYGIVGILFLVIILYKTYKVLTGYYIEKHFKIQISIIFFSYLTYGFLDNFIFPEISVAIFILLPLIGDLLDD